MPLIKEYMQKNVQTIGPDQTVCEAASLMEKHNITCLIVTENKKPTGIVSQKDIIFKVVAHKKSPEKLKIKEIMTSPIKSLPENKDLIEAAAMMNTNNRQIHRLGR